MTEIFELLVDFNGSTRSVPESIGLFTTQAKAEARFGEIKNAYEKKYGEASWVWHSVKPRVVE
jgi:hypothetical protein